MPCHLQPPQLPQPGHDARQPLRAAELPAIGDMFDLFNFDEDGNQQSPHHPQGAVGGRKGSAGGVFNTSCPIQFLTIPFKVLQDRRLCSHANSLPQRSYSFVFSHP